MAVSDLIGTVRSYNGSKGYGFITGPDGYTDTMFSRKELPEDAREIRGQIIENRTVAFDAFLQPDGRAKASRVVIPYVEGEKVPGAIKSYSHKNGYGFARSSCLGGDIRFQPDAFQPPLHLHPGIDLSGVLVLLEVSTMPDGKFRATKIQFQTQQIAEAYGGPPSRGGYAHHPPSYPPPSAPPHGASPYGAYGAGASPQGASPFGAYGAGMKMCNDFKKGMCQRESCKFSHSEGGYAAPGPPAHHGYVSGPPVHHGYVPKPPAHHGPAQGPPAHHGYAPGPPAHHGTGMMWGKVKSFSEKNGYGFLIVPGVTGDIRFGKDVLVGGPTPPGADVQLVLAASKDGRMHASTVVADLSVSSAGQTQMKRPAEMSWNPRGGQPQKQARVSVQVPVTSTGQWLEGAIKTYSVQKGFGFISGPEIQGDVFFMKTNLPVEVRDTDLRGQPVCFELVSASDGQHRAQNVTLM